MRLVLASQSQRRSLLLATAGFLHDVRIPAVDETPLAGEAAAETVLRLAEAKTGAVDRSDDEVVLAADTIVVLDGESLGKPTGRADAHRMLTALSDKTHSVLTGWLAIGYEGTRFGVAESRVTFRELASDMIDRYVTETQPFDKAGAYALQGDNGRLILRVSGSRANVMGLPLGEVAHALQDLGIERSAPDR